VKGQPTNTSIKGFDDNTLRVLLDDFHDKLKTDSEKDPYWRYHASNFTKNFKEGYLRLINIYNKK